MIGIYFDDLSRGPGKVVKNLLSGLKILNKPFVINQEGEKNLILQNCPRLNGDLNNAFVGPNIATLPSHHHVLMEQRYQKIIVPSQWVKTLYTKFLPDDKIIVWPVGIDTYTFSDLSLEQKYYDFVIYYKNRKESELNFVTNVLSNKGLSYKIIKYGEYDEVSFRKILSKSKYCFVLANTESQGIAILEIMSSNLPLLVWDINYWDWAGDEYRCHATSIPYWDPICGESFYDAFEIDSKLETLLNSRYFPREYIIRNLSLEIMSEKIWCNIHE